MSEKPEIPEDLKKNWNAAIFFGEPACTEYRALIEQIASLSATLQRITQESVDLRAKYDKDMERLMDLIRHQRHALHDEGLVGDGEFAALVEDSNNGQRVARLERYDVIAARLAEAERTIERLKAVITIPEVLAHIRRGDIASTEPHRIALVASALIAARAALSAEAQKGTEQS